MTSVKPRHSGPLPREGPSEFDILKRNHRFLRDDEDAFQGTSWDDVLARKYYSALWKEYAVCDLKHYKSGNFALRWRTEDEVVAGLGETTCGNTRCKHHKEEEGQQDRYQRSPSISTRKREKRALNTLELPFGYEEGGLAKSALVKVVLCDKCVRKIMWKREQEKRALAGQSEDNLEGESEPGGAKAETKRSEGRNEEENSSIQNDQKRYKRATTRRRRRSRSVSPSRGSERHYNRR